MSQISFSHTGKLLIVDDNFRKDVKNLATDLIESGFIVEYWNGEGNDYEDITNVRILILDLDLSNGEIPKTSDHFHSMAVDVLYKIKGPYIVIIYAREFDDEDIEKIQKMYEIEYGPMHGFIAGISGYSKNVESKKLIEKINEMINDKEIFQLILLWEKILDKAKDAGLSKFVQEEFENEIILFVQSLEKDIGVQSLSREFILNMLRFVSRYTLHGTEFKELTTILKSLNEKQSIPMMSDQLLQNRNMYFEPNPDDDKWTGDIFKISSNSVQSTHTDCFNYKLLITPECYFAQNKLDSFLFCDGFPLDFESLSKRNHHPIYKIIKDFALPEAKNMTSNEYQQKIERKLDDLTKRYDRFYPIWNFSESENKYMGLCFDFQNINSISKDNFDKLKMERISRLDAPYIVELMQNYARYSTKIGTLNINRAHIKF